MKRLGPAIAILILAGCGTQEAPKPTVPFFEGLGPHVRVVTTSSPEARKYFDQGLNFLSGFNHDEAIRSFKQAAKLDPNCAMCFWGIAYANGPHINNPVVAKEREKEAFDAIAKAKAALEGKTDVERALVEAQAARFADPQPEDRAPLDQAYADAMRKVRESFPDDADVGAWTAEALMDLHPWDLWLHDGTAQPWTGEIVSILEQVREKNPSHPLASHLYIHAVEASLEPGKADGAADALRDLQPGLGHMTHMPSHIDVRTGRWEKAIEANTKAEEADRKYRAISPNQGFYRLYMAHNPHMLGYAAMMIGRSELAIKTMDEFIAEIPEDKKKEFAPILDGYLSMPLEVRMRFGKWDEILEAPDLAEDFPIARALRFYARGVAYAAKGEPEKARAEQKAFVEAKAKIPAESTFGNNTGVGIAAVADRLLEGEILYREGKEEAGLAAMREAVVAEDALRYDEPPGWIQPVRHALGASLLQSGKPKEAEKVFREDLVKYPENGWSLFGLGRALRLQKKDAEAAEVEGRFEKVWTGADIPLHSSCFCQPGV